MWSLGYLYCTYSLLSICIGYPLEAGGLHVCLQGLFSVAMARKVTSKNRQNGERVGLGGVLFAE